MTKLELSEKFFDSIMYPDSVHVTRMNIPLEKTLKSIDLDKFISSSVGNKETKTRTIDVTVRNSMIHKENIKLELPSYVGYYPNRKPIYVDDCEILRYDVGGHFVEHTDRDRSHDDHLHVGTLSIIPPLSLYPHTGGELVIHESNIKSSFYKLTGDKTITIKPMTIVADQNLYTIVYIPLGVSHSVNKVNDGMRMIIKYSLFVSESYSDRSSIKEGYED